MGQPTPAPLETGRDAAPRKARRAAPAVDITAVATVIIFTIYLIAPLGLVTFPGK
jgi:hypothetical protein